MAQTIQRSFTGGELAPALRSRADLVKYATGLALCENFIIRSQGGVYSRPGTKFICELDDSSAKGRLIPFQFNTEQTYILVFENQKMRVIKDGGLVLAGGGPSVYELATPYTTADLPRLQFTQSADVMTITHPDYDPRDLSRTDHDAWTLSTIDFTPALDPPDWASAATFSITNATQANPCVITTSSAHGLADDEFIGISGVVGMTELNGNSYSVTVLTSTTFELTGTDSTGYTAYTSGGTVTQGFLTRTGSGFGSYKKNYNYVVTAVNDDGVESLPSIVSSIRSNSLSTTGGILLQWDSVAGATKYRVYKDPSDGTGVYGWIGDSTTLEFVDFNIAPVTSDAPPAARDPFAASADDKPATVAYYQQRRLFGNTNNEPQTVYTTQTGIYNSLRTSTPARDDDAVTFTINSRQVNEIRHLIEMDSLVVLTSGGEYRVTEGQDQVLTPSTVGVRKQSNNGSSWVSPAVVDDTIIYVQDKGTRLRDINYEFTEDRFRGNDLTIMAEHLFEGYTVDEMSYAAEPYGILWCVRSDGRLLGLSYQRQHQIWAWHQHVTSDSTGESDFESVAVISEDGRDAPYFIVKRTIDGNTVRYVERMEKRIVTGPEDVWCVDSGLQYDGAAATTISGLDHLEGETVVAVADGNVVTGLTVSSGQITLPSSASKVTVGLSYTPAMELLDLDINSMAETLKGKNTSVSRVILEVEDSRGAWVGPKLSDNSTGTMYEIPPRDVSDGYSAIPLSTEKQEVVIDPTWSSGGGIRIEQRTPMPLAVLAVIPEVDIG